MMKKMTMNKLSFYTICALRRGRKGLETTIPKLSPLRALSEHHPDTLHSLKNLAVYAWQETRSSSRSTTLRALLGGNGGSAWRVPSRNLGGYDPAFLTLQTDEPVGTGKGIEYNAGKEIGWGSVDSTKMGLLFTEEHI
jgi:hypothetical protein